MLFVDKKTKLEALYSEMKQCTKCPLHEGRKNIVPGHGNPDSIIVFVGEAPGKSEDEKGLPFVGAAGKILTKAIESAGLKRSDVYITNVVRCRPPKNRTPHKSEIKSCIHFLIEELKIIKPRIVVALGRTAADALSVIKSPRGEIKDKFFAGMKMKIMHTYHPAALLYDPKTKEEFFLHINKAIHFAKESKESLKVQKALFDE